MSAGRGEITPTRKVRAPGALVKRALILAAILSVILFVTTGGPWSQFVGHSHWPLVEWVPFRSGVYPFDIVANVALFLPLGLVLAWRRGRRGVLVATLLGALLSISIEVYQVYTHGRMATVTDVLSNTCGTALGASLAARRSAKPLPRPTAQR